METELLKYSRTEFKLEDLKQKPLPEGVDPSKLEGYLSNEEFMVQLLVRCWGGGGGATINERHCFFPAPESIQSG